MHSFLNLVDHKPLATSGPGWQQPCTLQGIMAHSHITPRDRERVADGQMFQSLEFKQSRQKTFWASVGFHGVLVTVLIILPLLFHDTIKLRYNTTLLAPPPPEKPPSSRRRR
jgi:hypothetical protein